MSYVLKKEICDEQNGTKSNKATT